MEAHKYKLANNPNQPHEHILQKNGRDVMCPYIAPMVLRPAVEGAGAAPKIVFHPCQSICQHFNLVKEEDEVVAQISCGGFPIKRTIENAKTKDV